MTDTLRLCYIDGPWAFFTTQSLDKQWGDDWNDAPYEHNAGDPHEPCWHNRPHGLRQKRGNVGVGEICRCSICVDEWNEDGAPKWRIEKVAWECGDLLQPYERIPGFNSLWSVDDINGGATPWLSGHEVQIYAGATIEEFCEQVRAAGGDVYIKRSSDKPTDLILPLWERMETLMMERGCSAISLATIADYAEECGVPLLPEAIRESIGQSDTRSGG